MAVEPAAVVLALFQVGWRIFPIEDEQQVTWASMYGQKGASSVNRCLAEHVQVQLAVLEHCMDRHGRKGVNRRLIRPENELLTDLEIELSRGLHARLRRVQRGLAGMERRRQMTWSAHAAEHGQAEVIALRLPWLQACNPSGNHAAHAWQ